MTVRGIAPVARQDRVMWGIALVLVAYLLFSFIDTSAKFLALVGIPSLQLAFMRFAGHFVISTSVVLSSGQGMQSFASDRLGLTIARGFCLLGATVFNFVAIRFIPLTLTSTILFMAPLIICGLSWPLLGQRVGWQRIAAILVGFVGIIVATRPFGAEFHWAVFLSLGSAVCFAMYQIVTRMLAGTVATDTMQFYTGLVGTVVLAPIAFAVWVSPTTIGGWAIMIGLGVFGYMGHELMTRAYGFAEPHKLSPFAYSFMIFVMICSYIVFAHVPDFGTLLGASIVIAAGLFIGFRERELERRGQ